MLRGQPAVDVSSLVRIPLAIVVLVVVTAALAILGVRVASALGMTSTLAIVSTIVFRRDGEDHALPISGALVGATGMDAAAFYRLSVHDGRLVLTRVTPGPDGAATDILPFE